jgi:type II secretory pathway component GspD/PulD (secretin)
MPNYTKGEWEIHDEYNIRLKGTNRGIASTGGYSSNMDIERIRNENMANALLVSAAPDTYEALKALLDEYQISEKGEGSLVWDKALDAIAKAEGK